MCVQENGLGGGTAQDQPLYNYSTSAKDNNEQANIPHSKVLRIFIIADVVPLLELNSLAEESKISLLPSRRKKLKTFFQILTKEATINMEFKVQPQKLKDTGENIQKISKEIKNTTDVLKTAARQLEGLDSSMEPIVSQINNLVKSAGRQINNANKIGQVLQTVAQLYITTENQIVREARSKKTGIDDESSHALPKRDDIPKQIQDFLDTLDSNWMSISLLIPILQIMFPGVPINILWNIARKYIRERQDNLRFQDQHKEYTEQVEDMYDNASGSAKDVYDKYKKDVKIEEIPDPIDPDEEKQVSHYTRGSNTLYINMEDMDDRRGPASIYYHEYGHYVVDRMGWIKDDGSLSPEFKKFESAVKRDVQNFVDTIEKQKRAEYKKMGYSGDTLDRMVIEGTSKELREILGGNNTDVLDGVSDMIDAQTNSKYQITYRHPIDEYGQTYWEKDSSRQANEAFAEMFSADFCSNDHAEIEFMKKYFPNAYNEYQNLLKIAAK